MFQIYLLCRFKATNNSPLLYLFLIAFFGCFSFLFLFFFLPKVNFEGRPEGYSGYGGKPLVAVDSVVFLTDKCGDGPWRCEFPEQQKYNIVFRES